MSKYSTKFPRQQQKNDGVSFHRRMLRRIDLSEVRNVKKQYAAFLLLPLAVFLSIASADPGGDKCKAAVEKASLSLVRRELGADFLCGLSLSEQLVLRQSPYLLSVQLSGEGETAAQELTSEVPDISAPESSTALTYDDNGIPAQTVIPTNPAAYTVINGVYIKNSSSKTLDAPQLSAAGFDAHLQDASPQILIIHTHGSEAYAMPKGQSYVSTGTYRTADTTYNVVRIGDEIAATLSAQGLSVVHDRTLYDDPLYDGAYERSAQGIEIYLEKYPSITYVLDVHRDAVQDTSGQQYKLVKKENADCAQVSFVMGSNNDHWQENLKLAIAVSAAVNTLSPTVMRPITLRNSNYNQNYTTGSMLVEIGAAGNSLDEAITAARLFAQGFAAAVLNNEK